MKTFVKNYTFNAFNRRISFPECDYIELKDILLITNVTQGIIIYNFAKPGLGATLGPGNNTITLNYNTQVGMSNNDELQIIIDRPPKLVKLENSNFFTYTFFNCSQLHKIQGFSAYGQEQYILISDDNDGSLFYSELLKPWSSFSIEFPGGLDIKGGSGVVRVETSGSPSRRIGDYSAGTIRATALIT